MAGCALGKRWRSGCRRLAALHAALHLGQDLAPAALVRGGDLFLPPHPGGQRLFPTRSRAGCRPLRPQKARRNWRASTLPCARCATTGDHYSRSCQRNRADRRDARPVASYQYLGQPGRPQYVAWRLKGDGPHGPQGKTGPIGGNNPLLCDQATEAAVYLTQPGEKIRPRGFRAG